MHFRFIPKDKLNAGSLSTPVAQGSGRFQASGGSQNTSPRAILGLSENSHEIFHFQWG